MAGAGGRRSALVAWVVALGLWILVEVALAAVPRVREPFFAEMDANRDGILEPGETILTVLCPSSRCGDPGPEARLTD